MSSIPCFVARDSTALHQAKTCWFSLNSNQSAAQRNVENSELKVALFEWAFFLCNSLKSGLKDHLGDWRG